MVITNRLTQYPISKSFMKAGKATVYQIRMVFGDVPIATFVTKQSPIRLDEAMSAERPGMYGRFRGCLPSVHYGVQGSQRECSRCH